MINRGLLAFFMAKRLGLEPDQALKISLLSAMDNSNLITPVLTSNEMAQDKSEIADLKASKDKLSADYAAKVREYEALKEDTKKLLTFINDATNATKDCAYIIGTEISATKYPILSDASFNQ